MKRLLIYSIIFFSVIIVVELGYIFATNLFRNQDLQSLGTIEPSTTNSNKQEFTYIPEKKYTGRVIALDATTKDDFAYELTYTNQDNLKGTLQFDSDDIEKTTIKYINSNSETIEEKRGLNLNSLSFQDKFDIIILFDTDNQSNKPNDVVVNSILITVYTD